MKVKPIVAAICAAGIVLAPAYANNGGATAPASGKVKHIKAWHAGAGVNRNNGEDLVAMDGHYAEWYKSLKVAGLINVDFSMASHRDYATSSTAVTETGFGGDGVSNVALESAQLDIRGQVTDSISAHVNMFASANNATANNSGSHNVNVDEAYVTWANQSKSPLSLTAGLFYLPNGLYKRHDIIVPVTTRLLSTQAPAVAVGFVGNGLTGSAYAFNGVTEQSGDSRRTSNYGADVNYTGDAGDVHYNVGVSYLNNMNDVDYISKNRTTTSTALTDDRTYVRRVGSISAYGTAKVGRFDATVVYVSALREFSADDLRFQTAIGTNNQGAKPTATHIAVGYKFPVRDMNTRVSLGYQRTNESQRLGLPRSRFEADYSVNVSKNTAVAAIYSADKDYDADHNGTDNVTNRGALRVSVAF